MVWFLPIHPLTFPLSFLHPFLTAGFRWRHISLPPPGLILKGEILVLEGRSGMLHYGHFVCFSRTGTFSLFSGWQP